MNSLCIRCLHCRKIVSGKGSTFLLCEKALTSVKFPKYPPQPVIRCEEYQRKPDNAS